MRAEQATSDVVRHPVLALVAAALSGAGEPGRALLRRHGFSGVRSADLYGVSPLSRYVSLFEEAAELLSEPGLGLRLGRDICPSALGPLGIVVVNQSNLRQALEVFTSHIAALQGGTAVELLEEGGIVSFDYRIASPLIWPRRQDAEFSIVATASIIRSLIGADWQPLDVHFEHSRGPNSRALEAYFGVAPRFGEPTNRLVLTRKDLARETNAAARMISASKLLPFMERHLRDLLMEAGPQDIVGKVGAVIERRLGRGPLNVENVAVDLGLAPRTLQRELSEGGMSFGEVLQDRRLARADALLGEGELEIAAIALELGYADATAFSRAYKAWTGHPPRRKSARGLKE